MYSGHSQVCLHRRYQVNVPQVSFLQQLLQASDQSETMRVLADMGNKLLSGDNMKLECPHV